MIDLLKKHSSEYKTEENETDVRKSVDNYWKHAYNYITIENLYTMLLNNGDPEVIHKQYLFGQSA